MALPMVHLAVAHLWRADDIRLHSSPEYYLGAISPDAIHARVGSVREDKRGTHLNANIHNCTDKITSLWGSDSSPFAVGYGIHILCDRVWVEYYKKFRNIFDPITGKVRPEIYYNDTEQVDFMLYSNLPYREFLWGMLEKAVPQNFRGLLTANEIEWWKNRTLHWFDSGESEWKNEIKYLTYDAVCDFIENAPSLIDGAFKGLKTENAE